MTKRPELTPTNHEAVYTYYGTSRIQPWINKLWRFVGEKVYSPEVVMSDDDRREIELQLSMGKGALIASNHPSGHDVLALPGALRATGIPQIQETGALAKDSLFRGPLGVVSEATGSIPVFREKSHPDVSPRVLSQAANGALNAAANRLRNHESIVVMPEGTNSTDEALVQLTATDIKAGIARIALAATDEHSFILPVSIRYTGDRHQALPPRHPIVAFGTPITEYEKSIGAIKGQILQGMQTTLDIANSYARE